MALYKLARTFSDPANSKSGMAMPGAGQQSEGDPSIIGAGAGETPWSPLRPTKGIRSFLNAAFSKSGQPTPENALQIRPNGSMPNVPPMSGLPDIVYTPYFSRGSAAYVKNYGKVLTNPIGAGRSIPYRPQSSYGGTGQYIDGSIWWTNQIIPTNINLQGLTDPEALLEQLGMLNIQAVVRTTG